MSVFEFDPVKKNYVCPEGNRLNLRGERSTYNGKSSYTDWMNVRADREKGKQLSSHRMSVVEPVFGNITANKKLNRFSLRSKRKVTDQWRLFCLIHNIEKLQNYGRLAV